MKFSDVRLFAHCRNCNPQKPRNQSPSEWARIDAGITATGLLVWCKRCRMAIAHFTPETLATMLASEPRCECCPGGVHVN